MKSENGRQIKTARLQVVATKAPVNFLRQTQEMIFTRWLYRDQEELYLAEQYEVRRLAIETALKAEARRRLTLPPVLRRAA